MALHREDVDRGKRRGWTGRRVGGGGGGVGVGGSEVGVGSAVRWVEPHDALYG